MEGHTQKGLMSRTSQKASSSPPQGDTVHPGGTVSPWGARGWSSGPDVPLVQPPRGGCTRGDLCQGGSPLWRRPTGGRTSQEATAAKLNTTCRRRP